MKSSQRRCGVSVTCSLFGQVIPSPLNWTVCRHGATRISNDQSCCAASVFVSGTTRHLLSQATERAELCLCWYCSTNSTVKQYHTRGRAVMLNIIIAGVMQPSLILLLMATSGIWLLYNSSTKLYFATNGPDWKLVRRKPTVFIFSETFCGAAMAFFAFVNDNHHHSFLLYLVSFFGNHISGFRLKLGPVQLCHSPHIAADAQLRNSATYSGSCSVKYMRHAAAQLCRVSA